MNRLSPHKAAPTLTVYGPAPMLHFEPDALDRMSIYIDECKDEVGWLGKVKDLGKGNYYCYDVALLHQDTHSTTTEIQPADLVTFAEEVGLDCMEDYRMWGHSHVHLGVSPSGQDDSQMALFQKNGCDWFFRIIANKKGDMGVTFYNYAANWVLKDCPWCEYRAVTVDVEEVKREIAAKVRKKTYEVSHPFRDADGYYGNTSGYGYGWQLQKEARKEEEKDDQGGAGRGTKRAYGSVGTQGSVGARLVDKYEAAGVDYATAKEEEHRWYVKDIDETMTAFNWDSEHILDELLEKFDMEELYNIFQATNPEEDSPELFAQVAQFRKELGIDVEDFAYCICDNYFVVEAMYEEQLLEAMAEEAEAMAEDELEILRKTRDRGAVAM